MQLSDIMKARRTAFVTGLPGTTPQETLAAVLTLPAGIVLQRFLGPLLGGQRPSLERRVAVELATVALPILLGCTVLSDQLPGLIATILIVALGLDLFTNGKSKVPKLASSMAERRAAAARVAWQPRKAFVTNYRAGMMLGTIIAILGVDFPAFPRRFAKTESFGWSLMDLGVGGVVFASALTSRQARALAARGSSSETASASSEADGSVTTAVVRVIQGAALAVLPLVLLGAGRTVVHGVLNLQHHVSEYGVHWNFFLTVAAVTLLAALAEASVVVCGRAVQSIVSLRPSVNATALGTALVAAGTCLLYQAWLALPIDALQMGFGGGSSGIHTVQDFILLGPRPEGSFFAQNREGLAGIFGFFAIYLLGLSAGQLVLNPARSTAAQWQAFLRNSALLCGGLWGIYALTLHSYGPVSRRLANAPYVAWVVAVNSTVLWCLLTIDMLTIDMLTTLPGDTATTRTSSSKARRGRASSSASDKAQAEEAEVASSSAKSATAGDDTAAAADGAAAAHPKRGRSKSQARTTTGVGRGRSVSKNSSSSKGLAVRRQASSSRGSKKQAAAAAIPASRSSGRGGSPAGKRARSKSKSASSSSSASAASPAAADDAASSRSSSVPSSAAPSSSSQPTSSSGGGWDRIVMLEAINARFLASFMLANALTGAVNAGVNTLDTPDGPALVLLSLYVTAVVAAVVAAARSGLAAKFW